MTGNREPDAPPCSVGPTELAADTRRSAPMGVLGSGLDLRPSAFIGGSGPTEDRRRRLVGLLAARPRAESR